jgi:hypothetical protein
VLREEYASKYPYSSGKFLVPADTPIADPLHDPGIRSGLYK